MRIGIINRYAERIIRYEEVLSDIKANFFVITTAEHKEHLQNFFKDIVVVESLDDDVLIEEILLKKNQEEKIDILVCSHEFDIEPIAKIRRLLGIKGQSEDSARAYRNKVCMCQMLKEVVNVPRFAEINSKEDVYDFVNKIGYPFIVKPVDGVGSMGFKKLENREEVEHFLNTDFLPPMLAQEYILGDMYHVDGLFDGNKVIVSQPSKYINGCLAYRENKYVASIILSKDNPLFFRLNEAVLKVLKTLPAPDHVFPFHAEFFVTKSNEVVFCEVASRVGGGGINTTIEKKTGVNLLAESIRAQCIAGYRNINVEENNKLYGFMLIPPKSGVLKFVNASSPFEYVVDYKARTNSIGIAFKGGKSSASEVVTCVVNGENEDEIMEHFRELNRWAEEHIIWGKISVLSAFMFGEAF